MKIHPQQGIKVNSLYHIVFSGWSRDIEGYYLEFKSLHLFSKGNIRVEILGKMIWVQLENPTIEVSDNGTVKYHYKLITTR